MNPKRNSVKYFVGVLFFVAVTLSSVTACSCTEDNKNVVSDDRQLRQDIGEMLLVGFRGLEISSQSTIVRDMRQYHVGSVILFEYDAPSGTHHRNVSSPDQLKKLCDQLKQEYRQACEANKVDQLPLLIGIDQEGGKVCRMQVKDGFPYVPSHRSSAQQGIGSVTAAAQTAAQMLAAAGVNFDFAPVADVDVNPDCPVIGRLERSFSADTQEVANCCSVWLTQLRKQNVVGCLKHFPGHGSAYGDTHMGLVDVSTTWQQYELYPYRKLIGEGIVPAVMVAHVINKKIDSQWPASLSYATITELLRNQLGFDGVIVTDDLEMGAIVSQYDYKEVLYRAIYAGADLLCISNNGSIYNEDLVPDTVRLILQLVEEGRLSASQIHQAAERVRNLKRNIK